MSRNIRVLSSVGCNDLVYDGMHLWYESRMSFEEELKAAGAQWRFDAFELGESAALGGDVQLDVHERTTVLVGCNGAGKSAFLEKLRSAAWGASSVVDDDHPDPLRFACVVQSRHSETTRIRYECRWQPAQANSSSESQIEDGKKAEPTFAPIDETCRSLGSGEHDFLWSLANGELTRNDGTTDRLPRGRGLLNWWLAARGDFVFNRMVGPLHALLFLLPFIRAGVPRAYKERAAVVVPYPWPSSRPARMQRRYDFLPEHLINLTQDLARTHEGDRSSFDEFVDVGRRIQIFDDVRVQIVPNPEHMADSREPQNLAAIAVDGTNLGLLSDGTLRVMQILAALVFKIQPLVLIEEPEIAVHPGLLGRLLKEIDAYSTDRQIILSTQSPQVVDWAPPEALRLVSRTDGHTSIRSLSEAERVHVERYLNDEGTLGDFVYGGGLDG
jgi:predicted ATPase